MRAVPPGATLGVLGGGQLGRMFVHAAQRMGYATAVLDPDPDSPAGRVSHRHIRAAYTDRAGLDQLADACAAVTTEFENVPAQTLAQLAHRLPVAPAAEAVAVAQDRAREKAQFAQSRVPCAPHAIVATDHDLQRVDASLFPAILKTAQLGYDGKGQTQVASPSALPDAWRALGGVPCVVEKRLALAAECSVVVGRGFDGEIAAFPIQRNLHRDGILAVTEVYEGNVPLQQARRALDATKSIAEELRYVGVLCVEFFLLADGALVANEMAPRPHNSGHWTLDGCDHSQFELQVRTLAGLPLAPPRQHSAAVMLNLLGDLWLRPGGAVAEPPWAQVLRLPGAHLHLYGKAQPRAGRKMGHLTLTASDGAQARDRASEAARLLGLPALPEPA